MQEDDIGTEDCVIKRGGFNIAILHYQSRHSCEVLVASVGSDSWEDGATRVEVHWTVINSKWALVLHGLFLPPHQKAVEEAETLLSLPVMAYLVFVPAASRKEDAGTIMNLMISSVRCSSIRRSRMAWLLVRQ